MFTKKLRCLSKQDINIAGGKGASLGELIRANFPVPDGFVILTPTFERFLQESGLDIKIEAIIKNVKPDDINSAEVASGKIRNLILNADFPKNAAGEIKKEFSGLKTKCVAIRSSATTEDSSIASQAGELESYLNTTKVNLLENVKKCWASLFAPRAIFYRFENNLQDVGVSVAVVVQKMIQAEISGVCFTTHPVTKSRDQIVIEAGYGLGEAITGGIITPDTYIIHKNSKTILDKNIGRQEKMTTRGKNCNAEKQVLKSRQEKQKLPDAKILKLAEICKKIENYYKSPQDIEWTFENGKFCIVQSRPITTL
ncbi:PEP/pyruvate-binding domain-containing protein [Candidatus Falkowbacteria bacterium]|nr:PEP/pyruvate-binding domain-containing protein [Candidatus Falkowbacteria bacterium]